MLHNFYKDLYFAQLMNNDINNFLTCKFLQLNLNWHETVNIKSIFIVNIININTFFIKTLRLN